MNEDVKDTEDDIEMRDEPRTREKSQTKNTARDTGVLKPNLLELDAQVE